MEPDVSLVPPAKRRLLLTDATPEKLQEVLVDNPAGITVLRDELIGLLAEMDKQGREAQRAFFLQGWNGYGAYSVDRIGRGSLYIPNVCISVLGNIQPARLRSYLANALDGGAGDDGLFQRFQILVWPDASPAWHLIDRMPDNAALARAEKVFSRCANLPTESVRLRFAADAQKFFFEWWTRLEQKVRNPRGLHPALVAHLSKYRSLLPSLAALFELADRIADDAALGDEIEITLCHTQQAARTCAYLEAHARRAYSCIIRPELHAARELAKHIQRGALPERFSFRDVYQHGWAALDAPDRVAGAVNVLEESGWVRRAKAQPGSTGGRPPERLEVNPAIGREGGFDGFEGSSG